MWVTVSSVPSLPRAPTAPEPRNPHPRSRAPAPVPGATRDPTPTVWASLVTVQVLFGTLAVAGKLAFVALPPAVVAAIRMTSAAIILLALERILVPRGTPMPRGRDLAALAGLALLGVALNQYLFLEGLERTSAIRATLLITTIPPFTLLAALALRREAFRWSKLAGILLAGTGVALLLGLDALAFRRGELVGNLLIVANCTMYALYLVLSRPYLARYHALTVVARTFLFGALVMIAIAAPKILATDYAAVPASAWKALAWIVVGPTVGTYALNNWVLTYLDSSTVAAFIPLQPFVTALLAVPLLGETIGWDTLAAGALILAGVVLAAKVAHSRRAGKPV